MNVRALHVICSRALKLEFFGCELRVLSVAAIFALVPPSHPPTVKPSQLLAGSGVGQIVCWRLAVNSGIFDRACECHKISIYITEGENVIWWGAWLSRLPELMSLWGKFLLTVNYSIFLLCAEESAF